SKKTYLEILHRDVNKGSALLKILETFNIPKENVAAFGDELNDKEMLFAVKYGVVMENGNPKLKEIVAHKTHSNNENGIVKFVSDIMPKLKEGTILSKLYKNRTHRTFYKSKISEEELRYMIRGGRVASSSRNSQDTRYFFVNSDEKVKEVFANTKWAGALPDWNPIFEESPSAYIVLCSKKELEVSESEFYFNMGYASSNIRLIANELGYGSCVLAAFEKEKVEKIIGLSPEYKSHLLIGFGKPKDNVKIVPGKIGELKYYRIDENNYVPKLLLEDLILGII
ncbi:MAG: HAD-IIB family hydrolase, partial [Fusobacteriaceae bacterium]